MVRRERHISDRLTHDPRTYRHTILSLHMALCFTATDVESIVNLPLIGLMLNQSCMCDEWLFQQLTSSTKTPLRYTINGSDITMMSSANGNVHFVIFTIRRLLRHLDCQNMREIYKRVCHLKYLVYFCHSCCYHSFLGYMNTTLNWKVLLAIVS